MAKTTMGMTGGMVGRLRQRVTIQQVTRDPDAAGQLIETWSTLYTVYAEVMGTGGDESLRGQQMEADVVTLIRIRYPRGGKLPTPLMRVVVDGNRYLNIARVLDRDGNKSELYLHCKEMD